MFTGEEIRQKRNQSGLSAQDLANLLKVSKDNIYKWEKGHRPKNAEDYMKVENWLAGKLENVPRATLAEDSGEPGPGQNAPATSYLKKRQDIKNGPKKYRVPFYDAEAVAGITETEMTPIHAPAGTIDIGDLLHDSKAAIRIYGNSMLPSYPPGCVLGLAPAEGSFIET